MMLKVSIGAKPRGILALTFLGGRDTVELSSGDRINMCVGVVVTPC